jgi:N-ethylmaleimide reductase
MKVSRRDVTAGGLGILALASGRVALSKQARSSALFDPLDLQGLKLPNRMVMAPMTRGRAGPTRIPNALMAEYYGQRAAAGLIVTEGVAISPQGYGWRNSPGIYTDAQAEAWQPITRAVHEKQGRIFLQLWHTGRVSHPEFQEGGVLPVGPSAIAAKGSTRTPAGESAAYVQPRALTQAEIPGVVRDYARAAKLARQAGFDGVEIHGANGYLIDQFIRDGSNQRKDRYGGSLANRLRFLVEVTEAVAGAWSAERVGVRLSTHNPYNDMQDSDPRGTFTGAAKALSPLSLAYLHVVEELDSVPAAQRVAREMRSAFKGVLVLNGGYDAALGAAALESGEADLIAYGKPFISNPDLVRRYREGLALSSRNTATFYTEGAQGYTDYPIA